LAAGLKEYHQWIVTPQGEYGLGPVDHNVPGQDSIGDLNVFQRTSVNSHSGESRRAGVEVNRIDYVDYDRLTNNIRLGPTGRRWIRFNCNDWVEVTVSNAF
jgi:hypothetical protein